MSKLLTEAIKYAAEMHCEQKRKISGLPYIVHPIEACAVVASLTTDEEVLAAAVLHDIIEDTAGTEDEIAEKFGRRVADLVLAESENKREEQPEEDTWKTRKSETVKFLQTKATRDEKVVTLGDKLSNMRAIYRDYRRLGDQMWQNFHEHDPEQHHWYYASIAEAMKSELSETEAWQELNWLIEQVWG